MQIPPYIKKGNKIGVVAPAKQIDLSQYQRIEDFIQSEGFAPVMGKTTQLRYGPFAGTARERAADLQEMLDNPEIKAILCVRGGYGAIQLIDKLKLDNFNKNPKWLVGFSDITLLHALLGTENIASIHGAMPVNYTPDRYEKGVKQLFETLQGKLPEYSLPTNTWNKPGIANAEIVGGNLAIVCSLLGTPLDIDTNGKILFLEEVGEYLYRFDRMMYQLKLAGKLDNIKGLIVGGMSDMNDSEPYFEEKLEELILRQLSNNIPVLFDFPAGHIVNNQPIILGKETTLVVDERGGSLMY